MIYIWNDLLNWANETVCSLDIDFMHPYYLSKYSSESSSRDSDQENKAVMQNLKMHDLLLFREYL